MKTNMAAYAPQPRLILSRTYTSTSPIRKRPLLGICSRAFLKFARHHTVSHPPLPPFARFPSLAKKVPPGPSFVIANMYS